MSSIFGLWCRESSELSVSKSVQSLAVWNKMYGSDGYETSIETDYGLGCYVEHLSDTYYAGAPVLHDEDNVIVIDAILYNRSEIFNILNLKGDLKVSDEELLWKLIKKEGYSALKLVNGDFAGAVYNKREKVWTVFRDHMGIRPLFYYMDKEVFAFSTDIRGILAIPEVDKSINEEKLYLHMMGYNDLTYCGTDFANIYCFRPATYTTIRKTEHGFDKQEKIYWKMRQKKVRMKSDEEYIKEFRRLIEDAIQRRMDVVPGIIGAELSGGLDSGVISILIHRLGREGRYFSWSQPPENLSLQAGDDERKIIMDICEQEGITCEYTNVDKIESKDAIFEQLAPPYINTGNLSDSAAYLKSQGARVVFTGHGGDEGVSHRNNPFELWYHKEYGAYMKCFWEGTKGQRLRILRAIKRMVWYIKKEMPGYCQPYENTFINSKNLLNNAFKERMADVEHPVLYFSYDPAKYYEQGGPRVRLDNVAYHGAKFGMRYMVPFLDYRVFDFAVSIPRRMYLQNGMNRYIYRQAFKDIIPESLYRMRYKDTASQRNYKFEPGTRERLLNRKEELAARLDKDFWKEYLDFEAIDQLTLDENFTKSDYLRIVFKLHDLSICCMIQNVKDNAAKWCEEHNE